MSKALSYLSLLSLAAMVDSMPRPQPQVYTNSAAQRIKAREAAEERERIYKAKLQETVKANSGLKPFDYNGTTIYALNQRNADKKARKQGLI